MSRQAELESGLRPLIDVEGLDWRRSIQERMDRYKVPGVSIAVIDGGEIAWAAGYGRLSADSGTSVGPESLFQVASISKPVTALGLLTLVQENQVSLDEDVNRYLSSWQLPENPDFENEPVSLRHILSHTGGLTVHGFLGYRPDETLPNLVEILDGSPPARNEAVRIAMRPGEVCQYSGGGTTVATLLMSDVLQQPFIDAMQERVLEPLNMSHSFYSVLLPDDQSANSAMGHSDGRQIPLGYVACPELGPDGLWSTPTDIAKFALALSKATHDSAAFPISSELVRQMLTPQVNAKFGEGRFGLGPIITGDGSSASFGHSGYSKGYMSNFVQHTNGEHGAVVFTNADEGYSLLLEIMHSISEIYEWGSFNRPRYDRVHLSDAGRSQYIGSYEFIVGGLEGQIDLEEDGEGIYCTIQAGYIPRTEIIPIGPDRFAISESPHLMTAQRNEDGKIVTLAFLMEGVEIWKAKRL